MQPGGERVITNVVFMGMGEPLANYRNVVPAAEIMMDDLGFDISRRRVTVSTSGLVPQMLRLAEETNCALAVSLHAPNDALRDELVPINRKHPIAELLDACWQYVEQAECAQHHVRVRDARRRQRSSRARARAGAAAAGPAGEGEPDSVQSVPGHALPALAAPRRSSGSARFCRRSGVIATTRRTRGDDIDAACGQLVGRVNDRTTVRLGSKLISVAVQP